MKILILSPLFPPDTAFSAVYTKELTRRLGAENEVTTILFGRLPESVSGVTLQSIDKLSTPLVRTWRLLRILPKLIKTHDVLLIQNGPSVELACALVLQFTKRKTILMESDRLALVRTKKNTLLNTLHRQLMKQVDAVYTEQEPWPIEKPLIHPLKILSDIELTSWEKSWHTHLAALSYKYLS
jgi:hypothetical protein